MVRFHYRVDDCSGRGIAEQGEGLIRSPVGGLGLMPLPLSAELPIVTRMTAMRLRGFLVVVGLVLVAGCGGSAETSVDESAVEVAVTDDDGMVREAAGDDVWVINGCRIRPGTECPQANLRYAELSGADLSGASLRYADLWGVDLSGANLLDADLSGANLTGADLRWAFLSGAVLSGAVLSGADLRGSVLSGAVLADADLSSADLTGALLCSTTMPDGSIRGDNC